MNFLDVVFLIIVAFAVKKGYKKGVFATLCRVAGYVIGLIGTFLLYQPFQLFLNKQLNLVEKLSPWVIEQISIPVASQNISSLDVNKAVSIIQQKELPGVFKEIMVGYVNDFTKLPAKGISTLGQGIAYIMSDFIVSSLSFLILFTVITMVFRNVLPKLFNAASPKPVTKLDKLGGALLGTVGGLLSVAALVIILIPLASMGALKGNPSPLADQMHGSLIVPFLTNKMQSLLEVIFSS